MEPEQRQPSPAEYCASQFQHTPTPAGRRFIGEIGRVLEAFAFADVAFSARFISDGLAAYLVEGDPEEANFTRDLPLIQGVSLGAAGDVNHRALNHAYPVLLQQLLVRTVSCLEVFVADALKLVYLDRPDLLRRRLGRGSTKHLPAPSTSQLLSMRHLEQFELEVVEQEVRSVVSKPFSTVVSYFEKHLDVNVEGGNFNLDVIQDAHNERNIIVHALGQKLADGRRQADFRQPRIAISRRRLANIIRHCLLLAAHLDSAVSGLVADRVRAALEDVPTAEGVISFEPLTQEGSQAGARDYRFTYEGRPVYMKPVVISSVRSMDEGFRLALTGRREDLRMYLRHLRELARHKYVTNVQASFSRYIGASKLRGVRSFIEDLDRVLPLTLDDEQVRRIASSLNYSRRRARKFVHMVASMRLPPSTKEAMLDYMIEASRSEGGYRLPKGVYAALAQEFSLDEDVAYWFTFFHYHDRVMAEIPDELRSRIFDSISAKTAENNGRLPRGIHRQVADEYSVPDRVAVRLVGAFKEENLVSSL